MSSDKGFVQNSDRKQHADREPVPQGTTKIPVIEEQLRVDKQIVETGKLHVSKKVYTDDVTVEVPITREEFSVKRVPKNELLESTPPAIRHEGDTTIIPVLKEVLVKRQVLVEEVHITKRKIKEHYQEDTELRTEEVIINKEDTNNPSKR